MCYVYLLHFLSPIAPGRHTTQHYIGTAEDLAARIQAHSLGHGARLVQVALERGIKFQVVRVWHGGRPFERRLKNGKNAPVLCPICNPQAHRRAPGDIPREEIQNLLIPF